jgi:hypothetical protein
MHEPSYQTVRLSAGRHTSPRHGVCVMELASMLAGEDFSDHPASVSRPIAALLRTYNDLVDDRRRQDLYEYAARVVGTATRPDVERARADRLVEWADDRWTRCAGWRLVARLKHRRARKALRRDWEAPARYAVKALGRLCDQTHADVLGLIDELVELSLPEAMTAVDMAAAAPSFMSEAAVKERAQFYP